MEHRADWLTTNFNATTQNVSPESCGLAINLDANERIEFEATLYVQAGSTTPDLKVQIAAPSGASGRIGVLGLAENATNTQSARNVSTALSGSPPTGEVNVGVVTGASTVTVRGTVTAGATAGLIEVKVAQAVSDVGTLTVLADSQIIGRVL